MMVNLYRLILTWFRVRAANRINNRQLGQTVSTTDLNEIRQPSFVTLLILISSRVTVIRVIIL